MRFASLLPGMKEFSSKELFLLYAGWLLELSASNNKQQATPNDIGSDAYGVIQRNIFSLALLVVSFFPSSFAKE